MTVKLLPLVTCYTCNYFIFMFVSDFSSSASNDIINIELFYTLAAHAQLPTQAQSDKDLLLSVRPVSLLSYAVCFFPFHHIRVEPPPLSALAFSQTVASPALLCTLLTVTFPSLSGLWPWLIGETGPAQERWWDLTTAPLISCPPGLICG